MSICCTAQWDTDSWRNAAAGGQHKPSTDFLESRGASAICWDDTTRDDDNQRRQKVLNTVVLMETLTSNKARDSWDYF